MKTNIRKDASIFLAVLGMLGLVAIPALAGGSPPPAIGTTLAFDNGNVVTIQYSQNYFCNSPGPATSPTSSPCIIGVDAFKDPVPDVASNTLNVIVPVFEGRRILDPTLGANNFAQCPDTTTTLKCINHPAFTANPSGRVSPVPIHSHIISGNGPHGAQGGWWKLMVWLVNDPSIWPDPKTGKCTAGTGCLTSSSALDAAKAANKVDGPVITNIYLFFNVVSSNAK